MRTQGSGRRSAWAAVYRSIKLHPFPALGFALYWIWVVITLQGPIRFPLQTVLGFPLPSWCLALLAAMATSAAVALGRGTYQRFAVQRKAFYRAICLIMFVGLMLSTLWVALSSHPGLVDAPFLVALYCAGSLFMGVGSAAVFIEFCRLYARLGVQVMMYHGVVAMFAAMLYQMILIGSGLPELNMLINPLFPLFIYGCLAKSLRRAPLSLGEESAPPHRAVMGKVLATAFVQGLAFGLGLGLLLHWGDYMAEPRLVGSLCSGVAALLIVLTASKMRASFTSMIYLVGFPLMAAGFLVMACSSRLLWMGNAVQATGSCFQYIVISCLFVYLARTQSLSLELVAGCGLASLYLGQVLGGVLGSLLAESLLGRIPFASIASVICALLLVLALYISNSNRMARGWEEAMPGAADEAVEGRVRAISVKAGLSPRQEEILLLLVQGRNKATVARELSIAEETAKTHIRNIYGKVGVHSQQELIDLIRQSES